MKMKYSLKKICIIFLSVPVILGVLCLLAQSGLFAKEPTIDIKADNCYEETLRVTADYDYLPYSFYDQEGRVSGHDVELMIMIANELHMNLELQFEPWNMGIRAALADRMDILMTCDYLDSFEGSGSLLKTVPVAMDEFVVYSRQKIQSPEEMYHKTIAVMENGNVMSEIQMYDLEKYCVIYKTNAEAMEAVENGDADCVILRYTVGEAMLRRSEYRDISAQLSIGQSNVCFGITKENRELKDRIDEVIEKFIANGEMKRLREKWLTTFVHTYSFKELLLNNLWFVVLMAVILAGMILLSIRNTRKKYEAEKEKNQYVEIVENLANDFDCVNYVQLHDNKLEDNAVLIRISDVLARNVPGWTTETNFARRFDMFVNSVVAEEDREYIRRTAKRENILAHLYQDGVYFVDFKAILDGVPRYCQLKFNTVTDEKGQIKAMVFGLHNVDEDVKREAELAERERQTESLADIVSQYVSDYDGVLLVNLNNGLYRVLSEKKGLFTRDGMTPFAEAFRENVLHSVHAEDREALLSNVLDFEAIRNRYAVGGSGSFEYRCLVNDEYVWYRITLNRISKNELLIGSKECNDEIITRIVEDKLLDEYDALYLVNLNRNEVHPARSSRVHPVGAIREKVEYRKLVLQFADEVAPQYYEDWVRFSDPRYMKQYMAGEDHREYVYELPGAKRTMRRLSVDVVERESGEAVVVLLSFMGIDDARAEAIRLHRQLAVQQEQLQEALSSSSRETLRTDLVIGLFNASKWQYEISADDRVLASWYAANTAPRFNIDHPEDPMVWVDYFHPDDREHAAREFMAAIEDHSGKTAYNVTFRMLGKDGGYYWIQSAGRVIRRTDGSGEFIGMSLDLTERMNEQEKQRSRLTEALSQAQAANNAKTTFLFNMSHDIRTPMNAILGYTDLALLHENDTERVDDSLRKIKSSGGHLLNLINDILEMSRIESGRLELSEEPLDIRQAVENVEDMSRAFAVPKSLRLEAQIGEIENPYVLADELHFNEVLINILSNAMKYSNEDGTVRFSFEQVRRAEDGKARYRFIVEDNGIGMSEEFLEHIYENFSREKNTTASRLEGTGLGLSIVKRILDLAGGTIDIRSQPGKGTVVTVEFPLRVMEDAAIEEYRKEHKPLDDILEDYSMDGKRVLLVEDNEMNREIAEEILTEAGLVIETAEDGDIAVRMFGEKENNYYDFILMDIQMPVMNGYDATRAIRKHPNGESIPIIAVSANAFDEDKQKSFEAGMNGHVAKPIDVQVLLKTMRELGRTAGHPGYGNHR